MALEGNDGKKTCTKKEKSYPMLSNSDVSLLATNSPFFLGSKHKQPRRNNNDKKETPKNTLK